MMRLPRRTCGLRASALLTLGLSLLLTACATSQPYIAQSYRGWEAQQPSNPDARAYRVFLIGDVAKPPEQAAAPALDLLAAKLAEAGDESAVVFLGDQLWGGALPDSGSVRRAETEAQLMRIVEALHGYEGRVVILPGNQDWNGAEAVARQEAFFEHHFGDDVFLPDEALPGPAEIKLADGFRLIAFDSEWWLRDGDKPTGESGDYEVENSLDLLLALDDLIQERKDDRLLVATHYPVFSNGEHGGHFTLREHLFPLTEIVPWAYVPLPVVGSLYPLYRSYIGGPRDLAAPDYKAMREALLGAMTQHPGIVYAAGHDHSLQYFRYATGKNEVERQHHIVSGAGGTSDAAAPGFGAAFVHGTEGFAVVDYYEDGALWLEIWEADGTPTGRLAFRQELEGPLRERLDPEVPDAPLASYPDYTDSTRVVVANPGLAAGPFYRFWFGDNYRAAWTHPVEARVLDLGREQGGLMPVKRGGGFQTVSLRMQNPDEREFVLRQVVKDVELTLPEHLHNTVAADVFADQITTSNPYGAYVVPRLADAAGLYHTNPHLRVVPDDPRLGRYRPLFADRLVLVEERPDDEVRDLDHFGNAEKVVSITTLRREMREDNDHQVDQAWYLRNRLFDLLIGDWDRHSDQWRWAAFEPHELDPTLEGDARTEGKIYRAIPRDRDQVFFKVTGIFPRIAQLVDPRIQDFDEDYGRIDGLTANGLFQDRRFLSELSREEWQEIARDLQASMTDEDIREALEVWREMGVYDVSEGDRVFRTLQARREKLPAAADKFYRLLARVVDVVGSDKHERFVVRRLNDDETEVTVWKTTKEGENRKVIYQRVFRHEETEEVRLYGLGGQDRFEIEGEGGGGLFVRAIGGAGKDSFTNRSRGRAHYYDTREGNTVERGTGTRTTLADDPRVNLYEYYGYQHPARLFVPFFGYNDTDGLFVGGGVKFVKSGFRKDPYARSHTLAANISTRTAAVNAYYRGHWVRAVGAWDAVVEAELASPQNVRNFFGLGNETTDEVDYASNYEVQLARIGLAVGVRRELVEGAELSFAPRAFVAQVDENADLIESDFFGGGIDANTFEDQWYAGAIGGLDLARVDRPLNPRQGFRWDNRAEVNVGVRNASDVYSRLESAVAVYVSPRLDPQATLALRVGAAHVLGDFPFYEAATLGGSQNLRGYRSTRYAGRTAFYQNVEARLKLFTLSTYAAPGELGVLGFFDNGRVWTDGESSSVWHQGYGGGLWMSLFDAAVLSGTVGFSADGDYQIRFGFGFLY